MVPEEGWSTSRNIYRTQKNIHSILVSVPADKITWINPTCIRGIIVNGCSLNPLIFAKTKFVCICNNIVSRAIRKHFAKGCFEMHFGFKI